MFEVLGCLRLRLPSRLVPLHSQCLVSTLRLTSVSTTLTRMYGIALDIVTGTPRHTYGTSILYHLQTLGIPSNSDFPNIPLVSRATAYRTAIRSRVLSPLSGLVDAARDSDEAYFLPRHRDWADTNTLSYLFRVKRSWRPFLVSQLTRGSDTTYQSVLLKFLRSITDGGELRATLVRRAVHYGFLMPELLVANFVANLNAFSSVLPPFVMASVLRTVCNAWTTSRRFRDEHPHPTADSVARRSRETISGITLIVRLFCNLSLGLLCCRTASGPTRAS